MRQSALAAAFQLLLFLGGTGFAIAPLAFATLWPKKRLTYQSVHHIAMSSITLMGSGLWVPMAVGRYNEWPTVVGTFAIVGGLVAWLLLMRTPLQKRWRMHILTSIILLLPLTAIWYNVIF